MKFIQLKEKQVKAELLVTLYHKGYIYDKHENELKSATGQNFFKV